MLVLELVLVVFVIRGARNKIKISWPQSLKAESLKVSILLSDYGWILRFPPSSFDHAPRSSLSIVLPALLKNLSPLGPKTLLGSLLLGSAMLLVVRGQRGLDSLAGSGCLWQDYNKE